MKNSLFCKSLSLVIIFLFCQQQAYPLASSSKIIYPISSVKANKTHLKTAFLALCATIGQTFGSQCSLEYPGYKNPYPSERFATINPTDFDNQIGIQLNPSEASLQAFDNVIIFGFPQVGWFNRALTLINLERNSESLNAFDNFIGFNDMVNQTQFTDINCHRIDALTLSRRLATVYSFAGNSDIITRAIEGQLQYLKTRSTQDLANFIHDFFFPFYCFWFESQDQKTTFIDAPDDVILSIAEAVKTNPTIDKILFEINERVPHDYLAEFNNITTTQKIMPRLRIDLKFDPNMPYNSLFNSAFDDFLSGDYKSAEEGFSQNLTKDATFNLGLSRLALAQERYENKITNDSTYVLELNNTAKTFSTIEGPKVMLYLLRIANSIASFISEIPQPPSPENTTNISTSPNMTDLTNGSTDATNPTPPINNKTNTDSSIFNTQNIAIGSSIIGSISAIIIACLKCRKKEQNTIIVKESGEIALPEVYTTGSEITDILRIIQELSETVQKEGSSRELMLQIDSLAQAVGLEVNDDSMPQSRLQAIAQHYQEMVIINESA